MADKHIQPDASAGNAKPHPSRKRLRECLFYGKVTGKLYWIERRRGRKTSSGGEPVEAGSVATLNGPHWRPRSYKIVSVDGVAYMAHRLIWIMHYGDIPAGYQIDHIDGNGLNNLLSNLRLVTPIDQARNRARPMNNTTGHVGVYPNRDRRSWDAFVGGKRIGTFGSKREAHERAESARLLLGYHKNHGRD